MTAHDKATFSMRGSVLQPKALKAGQAGHGAAATKPPTSSSLASVSSAVTRSSSVSSSHSLVSFAYDRSHDVSVPATSSRSTSNEFTPRPDKALVHGGMPYRAGWLGFRSSGSLFKKADDRYVELAGPCILLSASPNTAILGCSYQIYDAVVAPDGVPTAHRISVKTAQGDRITLTAENRAEYQDWLRALQAAAARHINKHYVCDRVTGVSPLGSVAVAHDLDTGAAASVRMTSKAALPDPLVALARREALNLLSCPAMSTIPTVLDSYETPTTIYCVTEFVPAGTSIRELVQARRPLSERDTSYVMQSLLQTLSTLLDHRIVHRGVTADSVHMVSPEQAERGIKLTSFEFAVGELDSPMDVGSALGVMNHYGLDEPIDTSMAPFVAPEVVKGDLGSVNQDSWSAGILMHYMLVAATPFDGADQTSADALRVVHDACGMPQFRGVMWDGISSDAKDLCAKLLHADPNMRLSPEAALAHRWFRWNH